MSFLFTEQSNSRIRWLLAELTIIVLGILIAFQLEEWRENRTNRIDEKVGLASIIRDLEIEKAEYADFVVRLDRNRQTWLKMMQFLRSSDQPTEERIISNLGRYLTRQWNPTNSAFLSLSSSGRLDLISDYLLQDEIVEYYELTQEFIKLGSDIHIAQIREYLDILLNDIDFVTNDDYTDTREFGYKLLVQPNAFPSHPSMMRVLVDLDRSAEGTKRVMETNTQIVSKLIESIASHIDSL